MTFWALALRQSLWPFHNSLKSRNIYVPSFSHSNQYRRQIQCAQNSFSRNIMRITIRAVSKRLRTQWINSTLPLSKISPAVLVQSIRAKIQDANSKLFNHLHQIKAQKLDQLIGPQITTYIHTYIHTYVYCNSQAGFFSYKAYIKIIVIL